MKNKVLNKIKEKKSKLQFLISYMSALVIMCPIYTLANDDKKKEPPSFVTGLINLGNDATLWIIAADVVIAGGVCAWHGFKWKVAAPEDKPTEIKAIKGTVALAIVVAIASALVKLVLSYF